MCNTSIIQTTIFTDINNVYASNKHVYSLAHETWCSKRGVVLVHAVYNSVRSIRQDTMVQ